MIELNISPRTFVNEPAAEPSRPIPLYVAPTPEIDVMEEQFDYLLDHSAYDPAHNPYKCSDCERLSHIRYWLLKPFQQGRKH
jgi:hypothetical protein